MQYQRIPEETGVLVTKTFRRLALHPGRAAPGPLDKLHLRESPVETPPPEDPSWILFPSSC